MTPASTPARTSELLESAVIHHPPLSREGIQQRLFSFWFDSFVYNQIWEDPRVDMEALELDGHSRILTISSGGCNVLNYLKAGPEAIYAVDLNRNHLCLLRLKLAALAHLPTYEDFFLMFGCADSDRIIENYERHISPHLDADTRAFWETNRFLWGRRIDFFRRNFYHYSKLGGFLRFLNWLARLFGKDPRKILEAKTLAQQEQAYREIVEPFFQNAFVRAAGRLPLALYSLGIPPQQFAAMAAEAGGNIIDVYRERVHRLVAQFALEDNYFCWQAFGQRYDRIGKKALPDYLKEENFSTLKKNLDSVYSLQTTLSDFLSRQPERSLNRFVFLDSQDWMTPAQLTQLWGQVARTGMPGSRVIFRTAASASPLPGAVPDSILGRFRYKEKESAAFFRQDRSAIYGGFHLYVLEN